MTHQELVQIICRETSRGCKAMKTTTWCRPASQARLLINKLISHDLAEPLKDDNAATSKAFLEWFNENKGASYEDESFKMAAPAPKGLVVVDFHEKVILDYHGGPRPGRMGMAEALIHLKEKKLGRSRPPLEDLHLVLEHALDNDRVLHVELGKRVKTKPFDKSLASFVSSVKKEFGPGWFGAQIMLDPKPWTVEWYGPYPKREHAKAMLERIQDLGIEVDKYDMTRWKKHFKNPQYEYLH
jgi:hypothetical protein